jgi:hypothetical protein
MKYKYLNMIVLIPLLLMAMPVLAKKPSFAPVDNVEYQEECGACHFAYQPGMLPAASWKKLMAGLHDHFGENAELGVDAGKRLTDYLVAYAANEASSKRSARIMSSLGSSTPLRITEVPYIKKKHREVPRRLIQGNDKVKSLANCNACHTQAQQGFYSESGIKIPGHGRWDD